ncbi:MAG: hypothetical protein VST67_07195, partial [Nitrospirota bacterium]|nr:hypothetical protein [Nitrospirota bacterium]
PVKTMNPSIVPRTTNAFIPVLRVAGERQKTGEKRLEVSLPFLSMGHLRVFPCFSTLVLASPSQ